MRAVLWQITSPNGISFRAEEPHVERGNVWLGLEKYPKSETELELKTERIKA